MLIEDLIDNDLEQKQLKAVSKHGLEIARMKNPSKAVQLAAIKQEPNAFLYIENPDEDVQLAAVKRDGSLIHKIKNPSEKILKTVVNNNGLSILSIDKVPIDVINDCKDSILKSILKNIKESHHNDYYVPMRMMMVLKDKYNINWPELKIIKKSIMHEYKNNLKTAEID